MNDYKIIFLDVDGVLNRIWGENRTNLNQRQLEPKLVKHLEKIIQDTNASIIVSSTWRILGMVRLWNGLKELDFPYYDRIIARTGKRGSAQRGLEILDTVNEMGLTHWITLEDEPLHMYQYIPSSRIIKTHGDIGLTVELAEEAISTLNSEE